MYSIEHIKALKARALDKGFSLPKGFKHTSTRSLQLVYNGIGAEWMPKFIIKLITWAWEKAEAPAMVHDYEYIMADKTYWNFLVANMRMVYNSFLNRTPVSGMLGGLICGIFGWRAFKEADLNTVLAKYTPEEI